MDLVQAAIEEIELHNPEEHFLYSALAANHSIDRSTLSRRHGGHA